MKAYSLGLYSNDDAGNEVVFAETAKEAKGKVLNLEPDSFIDLYAHRAPEFDGMENYTHKELMKEKWRNNWWFDIGTPPDREDETDAEFYEWYENMYKEDPK